MGLQINMYNLMAMPTTALIVAMTLVFIRDHLRFGYEQLRQFGDR